MLKWICISREPAKLESKQVLNLFLNTVCHKWGICERAVIFISPPMQFAEARYTSVETNFCIMNWSDTELDNWLTYHRLPCLFPK